MPRSLKMPGLASISIVLPTYNEGGNIGPLIAGIQNCVPGLKEIIVVDDDSPDRTWEIVEGMALVDPRIRLIRRMNERGLTAAIRTGIDATNGDIIVWMDADLSMPPETIPVLLEALDSGHDLAFGSRYVAGGADNRSNVPLHRLLSRFLCRFASFVLASPYRDQTSGFMAIRRSILSNLRLEGDYGEYFISLLYQAQTLGYGIAEVGYVTRPRLSGQSKTASNPVGYLIRGRKYLATVARLRWGRRPPDG